MAENYYYSSLSGDEIESRLVGGVVFNQDQALTTSEKARARQNIGAGESDSTFKILGYFGTYEDMIQSLQRLPEPGDAYGIGTASPYDVYVYDGVHDEWVNNGPIVLSDAVIDDEDIATDTTWSSTKINTQINTEVGAVRTLANAAQTTADGKAPISHASSATTYGVGNSSNYGHVKLSSSPNASQGSGSGVAATPAAVQTAINAGKWKLLWTNPNPTSAFAAQTISLDLSAYQEIKIVASVNANNLYVQDYDYVNIQRTALIVNYINVTNGAISEMVAREVTIGSNGITFGSGLRKAFNSTAAPSTDDNRQRPLYIYAR